MSAAPKNRCKSCHWAKWQRTEKGNIKQKIGGVCAFPPIQMPALPECSQVSQSALNYRYGIWVDYGENCAVYQRIVT